MNEQALTDGQRLMLDNVLDSLDDLFDRKGDAETWLLRLLIATTEGFRGTPWEGPLESAANRVTAISRSMEGSDRRYSEATEATADLRRLIAAL